MSTENPENVKPPHVTQAMRVLDAISFEGMRKTTIESVLYASVCDIIMGVCGKVNNQANEVWRRLSDARKTELQGFIQAFQFPGRGQSLQPVITLQGALKLIMWLPGDMAKGFHSQACDILTRHLSGDETLAADTAHNASIGVVAA